MRNLGELWQKCLAGIIPSEQWEFQRYLLIENVQYFDNEIKDVSFDKGLIYDTFGVGNCISSKLDATIIPKPGYDIPKNAEIIYFVRIATAFDGETPWHPFGTYYVHNRTKEADKLKIEAYDGLRALEVPYLDGTEQITWPVPCTEAMVKILNYLGVELDPRTVLNPAYFVYTPDRMTMRQVLSYIGSMHAGNWYLTEENKLRLVVPSIGSPVAYINKSKASRIVSGTPVTYNKVKVVFGQNDDDVLFAGEGDSMISLSNPWATQEIVDNMYNVFSTHTYRPFELSLVDIDPAIELGDTIDVEGELVALWQITYSLRLYATISIPAPSEGGESTEFGSDSSSLQNVYYPVVRWDFNRDQIKVGQIETQIAAIDVNVTIAGNAQGMFNVTLISDRKSEVIIRIYDNDVQQLYSPITKVVEKGFNQIGIPHSYIRLRTGLHLFTVTIQTRQGEILMSTRSVMYSVELFSLDVPPLEYDIRDVSLQQPEFALEPTSLYMVAMHKEGYPLVLTARYLQGRRLLSTDFTLLWEFSEIQAKQVAIEFDGVFELLDGQEKQTLVTDVKPMLFWTDPDDILWCQYGDEVDTRVQLATNVLNISVCRGWNSKVFPEQDMGLVVAYIKYDGFVAYRTKIGKAAGTPVWESEELLEEAGGGNTKVHVHRLNDYRLGFSVTGCNKHFITKRTTIGAGAYPDSVRLRPFGKLLWSLWYDNVDSGTQSLAIDENGSERQSVTTTIIKFNYPIYLLDESVTTGISAEKQNGQPLNIVSLVWLDNRTIRLETEPYSLYADLVIKFAPTSAYIYTVQNELSSSTWFVPTTSFIVEGEEVPMQYAGEVQVRASFVELSIVYDGLEFIETEVLEYNVVSVELNDFNVLYNALNFLEQNEGDDVDVLVTFELLSVHHEYVGSEPL